MSVVYCDNCDTLIDLDYNAEHFIYETGQCALEAYDEAGDHKKLMEGEK